MHCHLLVPDLFWPERAFNEIYSDLSTPANAACSTQTAATVAQERFTPRGASFRRGKAGFARAPRKRRPPSCDQRIHDRQSGKSPEITIG